jgi:hypothetical protein
MNFGLALVLFMCSFALHAMAFAEGTRGGGGGDICEDRIQQIRDDLKSWIYKGGAQNLSLPQGVSTDRYADLMLDQIRVTRVKCVGEGDAGYPVTIESTPKVCKFSADQTGSQIVCDYQKFLATSESDQYVLIHHEYAGLAGIELPNGDDSHYGVSNQISDFLEVQNVKKLAVKPVDSQLGVGSRIVIENNRLEAKSAQITAIISEKNTYYRVWLCHDSGQFCQERVIEESAIKGVEVGSLSGVKKGQKAVCDNLYAPINSAFVGRVAHLYSNGFVEIDTSTNKVVVGKFAPEPLVEPELLYWSAIPEAREAPRFGYHCVYR